MANGETTVLHLDPAVQERVDELARTHQRTSGSIISEAIEEYVERASSRDRLNAETLNALEHYRTTGLHLTGEEVDAWLGRLEAGEDAPVPECHV